MTPRLVCGLLLLAACSQDQLDTLTTGVVRLEVVVDTAGTKDTTGFVVQLLPYPEILVPSEGVIREFKGVYDGGTATITGGDPWCHAAEDSLPVSTAPGDTTVIRFDVNCDTILSTVWVVIQTTMIDPDPDGYTLTVNGLPSPVGAAETLFVHGAAWGPVHLSLSGFSPWCSVATPDRSVPFSRTDTATVSYAVSCASIWFPVAFLARFLGDPLPGQSITIQTDSGATFPLEDGETVIRHLRYDRPWAALTAVAASCVSLDGDGLTITPPAVGDTVRTGLSVACGQAIVFAQSIAFDDIYTMRRNSIGLDNGTPQQTGGPMTGLSFPRLSPDRSRLVGTKNSWDGAEWQMVTVLSDASGAAEDTVHGPVGQYVGWQDPAFTADGQSISYLIHAYGGAEVHLRTDLAGGQLDTLVLPPGASYGVVWAPDGQHVAFPRDFVDLVQGGIVIATPGSTIPVKVLPVPAYPWTINWSRDGSKIAFSGAGNGIYVVDVGSGVVRRLSTVEGCEQDLAPEWSPDGEFLVFLRKVQCGQTRAYVGLVRTTGAAPTVRLLDRLTTITAGPYWSH